MKKEKLLYGAVIVVLFGLALAAVILRWDDIVESGAFDQKAGEPSTPPGIESGVPSPEPTGPQDLSIYSLVPTGASCATPDPDVERNEIESGATPEEALPAITGSVELLREVLFESSVPSRFLDSEEFKSFLERKLDEAAPSAHETEVISRLYEMLGAIEPGTNVQEELEEFYTDQITGLYLPNKNRLLVSTTGSELGVAEETVLAHELGHALTDQAIGLPKLNAIYREDQDRAAAVRALVEGDATLLQLQYSTRAMSVERLGELQEEFSDPPEPPEVPYVVERSVAFPYDEGMRFACRLYLDGGWNAVNRAYGDLPTATADILFPHRYEEGIEPKDPSDPSSPGPDWRRTQGSTFGAAELMWLFEAPQGNPVGSPGDAASQVIAWNGGEYHVFEQRSKNEVALYIGLVDGGKKVAPPDVDPNPLRLALARWIEKNWPGANLGRAKGLSFATTWEQDETTYVFSTAGDELGLAAAPNYKVAAALARSAARRSKNEK